MRGGWALAEIDLLIRRVWLPGAVSDEWGCTWSGLETSMQEGTGRARLRGSVGAAGRLQWSPGSAAAVWPPATEGLSGPIGPTLYPAGPDAARNEQF